MHNSIHVLFNGFNVAGVIIGLGLLYFIKNHTYKFRGTWIKFWLVAIVLHQLYFLFIFNQWIDPDNIMAIIGFPFAMVHLPFFYFNIIELTTNNKPRGVSVLIHLFPYVIYIGFLLFIFFDPSQVVHVSRGFLNFENSMHTIIRKANGVPIALSGILYVVLSIRAVRNYQKDIFQYYSNPGEVDLKWVKHLVGVIILLFLVIFILILVGDNLKAYPRDNVFMYVSITLTVFIVYYGFRYIKQMEVFYKYAIDHKKLVQRKYSKSTIANEEMQNISYKILKVLHEDKLYLDEELTLSNVADLIGESTQKVSETLNRFMKKSFYELVNSYRISKAKEILKDPSYNSLSIEGIAFECGFKSKSTFFKFFKKETGYTPNAFKNL